MMPESQRTAGGQPIRRSIRSNFAWTLAGNLVYGACQWLILVAIARLGNPLMVGTFALAQAITTPVMMFSSLQLRMLQATDSKECFSFGQYLALRYVTTAAALVAIIVWALVGGHAAGSVVVILIVAAAKSIELLSDVYYALVQRHEEMSRIAKSLIVRGILSLATLGGVLYLTKSLVFATLAVMLVWLAVFAGYDRRSAQFCGVVSQRPIFEWRPLASMARLGLPLGVTILLSSLNANMPRYFMEHFQGTRSLGLFSALATIQAAGMYVVMALGNAALPRMANSYNDDDWRGFRSILLLFLGIAVVLGLATLIPVLLCGDRIISLVFGREYAGQNQTFIWLAGGAAVSYIASVFGYAATASRQIKLQPVAYSLIAATTAISCYLLVPSYGGLGAAISICIASTVCFLLYAMMCAPSMIHLRARSQIIGSGKVRCLAVNSLEPSL
jgi:O-antigen/teichoic acid export membrane protein